MKGTNLSLFSNNYCCYKIFFAGLFFLGFCDLMPMLNRSNSNPNCSMEKKERVHRRCLSESSYDKRKIEMTSLGFILFNNFFQLYVLENFFIRNFVVKNNLSRNTNPFEYMSEIACEYIKYNKDRLDLNKIPSSFFKIALMAELSSGDKDMNSYVCYKIIFNKLVISVNCDKLSFIDLNLDDKFLAREVAPIVMKLRIFRPGLKWPESAKVLGLSC